MMKVYVPHGDLLSVACGRAVAPALLTVLFRARVERPWATKSARGGACTAVRGRLCNRSRAGQVSRVPVRKPDVRPNAGAADRGFMTRCSRLSGLSLHNSGLGGGFQG